MPCGSNLQLNTRLLGALRLELSLNNELKGNQR
jgi:hypothetical protein